VNVAERPENHLLDVEEEVSPAGKFRLYLGSVAGVGKTCAMLDEGWRRFDRGADVVIGLVETHGRIHTQEMVRNLEFVPRKSVTHRDSVFEEMDLDAILERRPEVVLIDELAHTNVPYASRHEKRWEDVLEILEAGIAVISTLNVQHIESIADAVESITGVKVRERVPDWVVRRADQIELIDSSPEQLRRRMLHGNIYASDKIPDALAGFFRSSNLAALRELALRFVADETEESLLTYLREREVDQIWETTERVLVVLSGADGEESVLHRASRYSTRLKTSMEVLLIAENERTSTQEERFRALRKITDSLDAQVSEMVSDDLATSVIEFARKHQITQVVLAAPTSMDRRRFRRSSTMNLLLACAGEAGIDAHLITSRAHAED
jgi:two-component system sensor histidine kinase KdpD